MTAPMDTPTATAGQATSPARPPGAATPARCGWDGRALGRHPRPLAVLPPARARPDRRVDPVLRDPRRRVGRLARRDVHDARGPAGPRIDHVEPVRHHDDRSGVRAGQLHLRGDGRERAVPLRLPRRRHHEHPARHPAHAGRGGVRAPGGGPRPPGRPLRPSCRGSVHRRPGQPRRRHGHDARPRRDAGWRLRARSLSAWPPP